MLKRLRVRIVGIPPATLLDHWLIRVAVTAIILLLLAQALHLQSAWRPWLSYVERLEGVAYEPALEFDDVIGAAYLTPGHDAVYSVTVMLIDQPAAPAARLLVNGQPIAGFEEARVTVAVRPGDRLALDARGHPLPLRFRIVHASPGLASPREGLTVTLRNQQYDLGIVATERRPSGAPVVPVDEGGDDEGGRRG